MFTIQTTYHTDGSTSACVVPSSDASERATRHEAADIAIVSSETKDDATERKDGASGTNRRT